VRSAQHGAAYRPPFLLNNLTFLSRMTFHNGVFGEVMRSQSHSGIDFQRAMRLRRRAPSAKAHMLFSERGHGFDGFEVWDRARVVFRDPDGFFITTKPDRSRCTIGRLATIARTSSFPGRRIWTPRTVNFETLWLCHAFCHWFGRAGECVGAVNAPTGCG
jgi:hypothetical protein